MYCVKCGEEINNGTVQCPYCGTDQVAHFKITYGSEMGERSVISDDDKRDGTIAKVMRGAKWLEDKIPQEKMKEIKDLLEPYVDDVKKKGIYIIKRGAREIGARTGVRKKKPAEKVGDIIHDIGKKKRK